MFFLFLFLLLCQPQFVPTLGVKSQTFLSHISVKSLRGQSSVRPGEVAVGLMKGRILYLHLCGIRGG